MLWCIACKQVIYNGAVVHFPGEEVMTMADVSATEAIIVQSERGLTIAGTRIALADIMDYLIAGYPATYIQHLYHLSASQIAGVLDYIEAHRVEVEAEYQQAIEDAEETRRYWEERNRERLSAIAAQPSRPEVAALRATSSRPPLCR
jgi:uncharacterized protein (DUF433 family)